MGGMVFIIEKYNLKYSYDDETDSVYIKIENNNKYEVSLELENGIIMDFSSNGNPMGLEILDVGKLFNISKTSLNHVTDIIMVVEISDLSIKLSLLVEFLKEDTRSFRSITKNTVGASQLMVIASA